jgi:GNAT superfamily N-acetyltransferase
VIGEIYWGWFYLDLLWVKDELRGRGYGHRLLTLAEQEARQRGAKNVYLDTFSFQAPNFYKQHGYQVFGELEDFPPGHQRYFLTKQL